MLPDIKAAMDTMDRLAYGKWEDACEIARYGIMSEVIKAALPGDPLGKLKVIEAYNNGFRVEYRLKGTDTFHPCDDPAWLFHTHDYRVAPQESK